MLLVGKSMEKSMNERLRRFPFLASERDEFRHIERSNMAELSLSSSRISNMAELRNQP